MILALVVASLVVAHDLNSMRIAVRPGQRRKVAKAARLMKLIQLAASCSFDGLKPLAGFVVEELGGFRIPERTDHTLSV